MKSQIFIATLATVLSFNIYAAKCRVDGKWYPYGSRECNLHKWNLSGVALPPPDNQTLPTEQDDIVVHRYKLPWDDVTEEAAERCRAQKLLPIPELNCRMQEELGYWAMHGNFELPKDIAILAKEMCIAKSANFSHQASCMQNESIGYAIFMGNFLMPTEQVEEARADCLQRYKSYSIMSSCMRTAEKNYRMTHKSRSAERD